MAAVMSAGIASKNTALDQSLVSTGAKLDQGRAALRGFKYWDLDSPRLSDHGQSLLFKTQREDTLDNITNTFQVSSSILINFSFRKSLFSTPSLPYDSFFGGYINDLCAVSRLLAYQTTETPAKIVAVE